MGPDWGADLSPMVCVAKEVDIGSGISRESRLAAGGWSGKSCVVFPILHDPGRTTWHRVFSVVVRFGGRNAAKSRAAAGAGEVFLTQQTRYRPPVRRRFLNTLAVPICHTSEPAVRRR